MKVTKSGELISIGTGMFPEADTEKSGSGVCVTWLESNDEVERRKSLGSCTIYSRGTDPDLKCAVDLLRQNGLGCDD